MGKQNTWNMIGNFERQTGIKVFAKVGRGRFKSESEMSKECIDFLDRYDAYVADCGSYAAYSFERHFGDLVDPYGQTGRHRIENAAMFSR